jgi:hypothetical protein
MGSKQNLGKKAIGHQGISAKYLWKSESFLFHRYLKQQEYFEEMDLFLRTSLSQWARSRYPLGKATPNKLKD